MPLGPIMESPRNSSRELHGSCGADGLRRDDAGVHQAFTKAAVSFWTCSWTRRQDARGDATGTQPRVQTTGAGGAGGGGAAWTERATLKRPSKYATARERGEREHAATPYEFARFATFYASEPEPRFHPNHSNRSTQRDAEPRRKRFMGGVLFELSSRVRRGARGDPALWLRASASLRETCLGAWPNAYRLSPRLLHRMIPPAFSACFTSFIATSRVGSSSCLSSRSSGGLHFAELFAWRSTEIGLSAAAQTWSA